MRTLAVIILCVLALLCFLLGGCASNRTASGTEERSEQRQERTVTTTETVRQAFSPTGELVELREKTRVVSDSTASGSSRADTTADEQLEVEPPKALGVIGTALKEGAKKVADQAVPGGGAVVESAWQAVSWALGLGAAGAGTKVVLDGRRRRREEDEAEAAEERRRLIAKAMNDYARDIEGATTDDQVRDIKTKHRERQRALGIHDDIERLLHG